VLGLPASLVFLGDRVVFVMSFREMYRVILPRSWIDLLYLFQFSDFFGGFYVNIVWSSVVFCFFIILQVWHCSFWFLIIIYLLF
jgi:hypothetical protein